MRPAFLPPISRGRKRRLLTIIPENQGSVFGRAIDGDPPDLCLRSLGLWKNDLENTAIEPGLDLVFLDVHADRDLPFEAAVETFAELALLVLRLGLHFAANHQIAVVQKKLDVFFSMPGNSPETVIPTALNLDLCPILTALHWLTCSENNLSALTGVEP